MKPIVLLVACMVWLVGCADPAGITDPVVENPKPVELAITSEHLSEAGADDHLLGKGDDQELTLLPSSMPSHPWGNATDRSSILVDTATGRILRLRLSLVPKVEQLRDTAMISLRRIVVEFDSAANLRLDSREREFRDGRAFIIVRELGMGGQIVYRALRVDTASDDIPTELRDSTFCKIKLWRTSERTIVFKLSIQRYGIVERQGQRSDVRRIRVGVLGEIPLLR